MFIDTHAHLNFKSYKDDLDDVIQKAFDRGIEKIICISSCLEDSIEAIKISKKYSGTVFTAVGIHPQCTDPENKDSIAKQLKDLENLIKNNKVVAIGECGLDYTVPLSEEGERGEKKQKELLSGQMKLAQKYDLPILIHLNKSHDDFLGTFSSELKKLRGVFHFYAGGKKRLNKFLEYGDFMFGVAGTVTYEDGIQNVVNKIPLDRIVLETDCPFLAPEPHRGERNEPSYIYDIAKKVSEIKEVDLGEVEKQTTKNAKQIFNI